MRALLLFWNDSTAIVAVRMQALLANYDVETFFGYIPYPKAELTPQQIKTLLGQHEIDMILGKPEFYDDELWAEFDFVVTAMIPSWFRQRIAQKWQSKRPRPALWASFPGIELSIERGGKTRRYADVICFVSDQDREWYRNNVGKWYQQRQLLLVGHPSLVRLPEAKLPSAGPIQSICFFGQGRSPLKWFDRAAMAQQIIQFAKANPSVEVFIKNRAAHFENVGHVHHEVYRLDRMLARHPEARGLSNLKWGSLSMRGAMDRFDVFVSCTSTATLEVLAGGGRSYFWHDYPGHQTDRLKTGLNRMGLDRALFVNTQDLLTLKSLPTIDHWPAPICDAKFVAEALSWSKQFRLNQSQSAGFLMPTLEKLRQNLRGYLQSLLERIGH